MNTLSRLLVELGLDDSGMESGLDKSKKNMQEWAKGLRDTGTKLTASVTAPVVGMFALMINGASDANESMSAVKTVYGDAADAIIDSSRKAANTVGLSQNQYLSAAATMGVYAQSAGITGDAMSKFGQDMIGASADLASFYNANPTDVLQAIQSGLMGEAEPLRKYGILISEASINQYAWTHGIAQTGEQLTEQQKVAARYGYIMANLGPASGDFERTSAGLANQMRILKARVKDVAAQFGVYLLPFMLKAAKAAQRLITFIQSLSDRQKKLVLVLAAVGAAIGPILIVISMMIPAVIALASAFGLLLGPIGLVVLAIAGLAYAYKTNFMGFGDAVNTVVGYVVTFSKAIAEAFTSGKPVSDLVAGLPKPLQEVGRGFLLIADAIGDLIARWRSGGFDAMLAALPEELAQIGQGFRALGRVLLNLAGKALDALLPAFGSLAGKILDSIGDLASGLKTWFENAVSSVDWGSFGETVGEKVGNLSRMLAPK
ncbi:MAG TPA: hypothetical protein PK691_04530, partial [Thermomicrobiales bacterium]|nr:hypothetical protein [Thermomicrobiales bacterium]